ncbi:MAG TPA: class I SAM-dependent methyltransferase [Candidatus Limnocylindrales bacterium]|jgi:SAM-dependent methyltransferase|nr:class I SAM-dependent methyltransferase [Candidatus Limnocylindrales bacterium]
MLDRPDPATAAALARLYDLDLESDPGDLDLYLALADRAAGRVLELAAGTGRLAVPLASAGHPLTAVDIDPAMLARGGERARAAGLRADAIGWIEADLLDVRLPDAGRYALAFLALNSIMLLPTRDAQRAAFQTLAAHLGPGGLAVVDAWLPDADDLARFDGRVILEWPRTDADRGVVVTKAGSAIHDAATNTVNLTAIYEESAQGEAVRRWVRHDRLRLVSADELAGFAEDAGLEVELVAGGYDLQPLGPGAERAVVIAIRR